MTHHHLHTHERVPRDAGTQAHPDYYPAPPGQQLSPFTPPPLDCLPDVAAADLSWRSLMAVSRGPVEGPRAEGLGRPSLAFLGVFWSPWRVSEFLDFFGARAQGRTAP